VNHQKAEAGTEERLLQNRSKLFFYALRASPDNGDMEYYTSLCFPHVKLPTPILPSFQPFLAKNTHRCSFRRGRRNQYEQARPEGRGFGSPKRSLQPGKRKRN
jgi:hypothetical protein